jgi:hypothetical protein
MPIASSHELARTYEAELGIPEVAVRRWNLVLSDNTLQNNPLTETEVISHLNLGTWGAAHPTWAHLGLRKVSVIERAGDSPYHAEAVAEYSFIPSELVLAPTSRRADWKFETQPGQVPALYYYHDSSAGAFSGNNDIRPLTNSAYDYLEGLVTDEALVQITITKNFWPFPQAYFGMQNFLNSETYMTCARYTLKCTGVTSDYTQEFFANTTYQYWATQIQLQFRASTWVLQIPDVGWNFLNNGVKQRAMVFDEKNSEWVASANPVGLNGSGNLTFGQPAILPRRVNPAMDFGPLLGRPPTDGLWPIGSL